MEDEQIIGLFMERSEDAISETSKKYGKYCHSIAWRILENEEDAEECVSDTYLRVWNSIPPKCPDCLRTFLGKIVRNLSLDRWEKRSADKRGGGAVTLILDELEECIPAADDAETAEEDMVIKDILNRFLAELPQKTRKMFIRRYWYMSSAKEIAADLGASESMVNVTLFRTREKLKKMFEKEGISL
ncbi:MAG: sigma-70 family RNA polymerase sigma factor [Clostridia bacterium]|nr:sigma-70 family RNA polymerase sigma factor [Clostridia bacterium]